MTQLHSSSVFMRGIYGRGGGGFLTPTKRKCDWASLTRWWGVTLPAAIFFIFTYPKRKRRPSRKMSKEREYFLSASLKTLLFAQKRKKEISSKERKREACGPRSIFHASPHLHLPKKRLCQLQWPKNAGFFFKKGLLSTKQTSWPKRPVLSSATKKMFFKIALVFPFLGPPLSFSAVCSFSEKGGELKK